MKNIPLVDCGSHAVHSGNWQRSARIAGDDYRNDYDAADTPKAGNSTGACHNRMPMDYAYDSNRRYCNRIPIEYTRSDNLETNVRSHVKYARERFTYIYAYCRAAIKSRKVYPA